MAILFSKVLNHTDVGGRMPFPMKSFRALQLSQGRHAIDCMDEAGSVWRFVCATRCTGRYPKSVLAGDWLQFVRDRRLTVGDRVTFYMEVEPEVIIVGVNMYLRQRYRLEVRVA